MIVCHVRGNGYGHPVCGSARRADKLLKAKAWAQTLGPKACSTRIRLANLKCSISFTRLCAQLRVVTLQHFRTGRTYQYQATQMPLVAEPPWNSELDLAFLDGLDLPDLQHLGSVEATETTSTSSDHQQEPVRPSKGQRYRQNRKVCRITAERLLGSLAECTCVKST